MMLRGKVAKRTAFRIPSDICQHGQMYAGVIKDNYARFWPDPAGEYSTMAEAKKNRVKEYRYTLIKFDHEAWNDGDLYTVDLVDGIILIERI